MHLVESYVPDKFANDPVEHYPEESHSGGSRQAEQRAIDAYVAADYGGV